MINNVPHILTTSFVGMGGNFAYVVKFFTFSWYNYYGFLCPYARRKIIVEILEINRVNDALAEMVALFLVELRSYKGIISKPNIEAGREEMEEYLSAKFSTFAALVDGEYAGYVVCRIDSEVVWVESIFVKEEYRRHGVATALHSKSRGNRRFLWK